MDYFKLVQSENTDIMRGRWKNYREELTGYIIEGFVHMYIKKLMKDERRLRIEDKLGIEEVISVLGRKPSLAIWGAGGCNDIDILELAKYFRLVLIDRDIDKIKSVRDKIGFGEEECLCVDISFWDIRDEDYLMYEALLCDGAHMDEITSYLDELSERASHMDCSVLPQFDYSVVAGLASQLNSRFAAMLHMMMYEEYLPDGEKVKLSYSERELEMLSASLNRLNRSAVEALLNAVIAMSKMGFVVGHELFSIDSGDKHREDLCMVELSEEAELAVLMGDRSFSLAEQRSMVAGNDQLEKQLDCLVGEENLLDVIDRRAMVWPFTEGKSYIMLISVLEKNINKTW